MNLIFSRYIGPCVFAVVLLLSGCAAHVYGSKKDPEYQQKLNAPMLVWKPVTTLKTIVSGRYAVTSSHREKSSEGISNLLRFLGNRAVNEVSTALEASAVQVVRSPQDAKTLLQFTPISGSSDCTILGCVHDVMVEASLTDIALKKVVWMANINVGAPFGTSLDDEVLRAFANKIVRQMKTEKLL